MNKLFAHIFLIIAFWGGVYLNAQTYEDEHAEIISNAGPPLRGYRHFISGDALIPNVLANSANRAAFRGIASLNLDYRIKVFKGLQIGPNFRYTGYNIASAKINNGNKKPISTTLSFGASIAYEVIIGDRFAYIPSVNVGAGWIHYQNLDVTSKGAAAESPTTWSDWGAFVSLNNSIYYFVKRNQRIGIGVTVGASYFSHEFNLRKTGLDLDSSILTPDLEGEKLEKFDKGPTFSLYFGFGVITKIGEIKR